MPLHETPFCRLNPTAGLFLLILTIVIQAFPGTAYANANNEHCNRLNKFIDPFVELAMFDGVIMVEIAGESFTCAYGFANYDYGIRHVDDTQFRIASVSKTITKAAFARLIQQEMLSLDDRLSRFLPEFPKADKITIRHLLQNTSGIAHTNAQPWGHGRFSMSLDEIVERLAETPFDFEPSEERQYSNGGYAVAAKVIEIAAGADYGDAMRALVFEPLGMNNSGHIDDARALMPRMAIGYEPGVKPGSRRHTRFYAAEMRPGGGSLYSTKSDLMLFTKALRSGDFVSLDLASDVIGAAPDEPFESEGRSPGFVAKIYSDPAHEMNIVSLSNNYSVPSDWAKALADVVLDIEMQPSWPRIRMSDMNIADDHPILGEYASNFGVDIAIEWSDGAAYFYDAENQLQVGMPLTSDDRFLLPIYYSLCEQDPETRVVQCEMLSGDSRYTQIYTPLTE